jgi:hypothetical protein
VPRRSAHSRKKSGGDLVFESVVRPEKDEVSVVSFTGESTLETGMTKHYASSTARIERVEFIPPSGYLGGGVVTNSGRVPGTRRRSPEAISRSRVLDRDMGFDLGHVVGCARGRLPKKTRRAIVLLSDGYEYVQQKEIG